ncbi:MAG: hypothetical protein QW478_00510 [Candidatus Micrarchaeaceae archaeon]
MSQRYRLRASEPWPTRIHEACEEYKKQTGKPHCLPAYQEAEMLSRRMRGEEFTPEPEDPPLTQEEVETALEEIGASTEIPIKHLTRSQFLDLIHQLDQNRRDQGIPFHLNQIMPQLSKFYVEQYAKRIERERPYLARQQETSTFGHPAVEITEEELRDLGYNPPLSRMSASDYHAMVRKISQYLRDKVGRPVSAAEVAHSLHFYGLYQPRRTKYTPFKQEQVRSETVTPVFSPRQTRQISPTTVSPVFSPRQTRRARESPTSGSLLHTP